MTTQPFERRLHGDTGRGEPGPMLLWRFPAPLRTVSSGMLGGGITDACWVVNVHVRSDYARLDPDRHLRETAAAAGLDSERGVGLLTAAKIERVTTTFDGPPGAEVRCDATVGVSYPTWAAAPDGEPLPAAPWRPGTINIVCQVPAPLTDAALVGAVITVTEAKSQALSDGGVPGTGTASDAIVICCPSARANAAAEPFAGPRSLYGARLARAVYSSVMQGLRHYAADTTI